MRGVVAAMPELAAAALDGDRERRRAMVLLSYLGHAYVWGESEPVAALPRQLAVPWAAVADALGRPPVLSYASYALDNWRRLDREGAIALGNIALLQNFLGGIDEEWFMLVHVEIETAAAPGLQALLGAAAAAAAGDLDALEAQLAMLAASLGRMHATLSRMPERCDPYIYFHRVRPYIHGWRDHPALPDGVVYGGVDAFGGEPQRFRGETGAQSSIVPAIDATLGVAHGENILAAYLREMRDYMPPAHRRFVAHLEEASRVARDGRGRGSCPSARDLQRVPADPGRLPRQALGVRRPLHLPAEPPVGGEPRDGGDGRYAVHPLPEQAPRRDALPPAAVGAASVGAPRSQSSRRAGPARRARRPGWRYHPSCDA